MPPDAILSTSRLRTVLRGPVIGQMTVTQLSLLVHLDASPGAGTKATSRALSITPAGVTLTARRLAKLGLMTNQRDPGDARHNVMTLTREGEDIIAPLLALLGSGRNPGSDLHHRQMERSDEGSGDQIAPRP